MSELDSNLVWIDLEMTGLDANKDVILEIATLVTDSQLTIIEEGPSLVIAQPKNVLESMSDWAKEHHAASGLLARVEEEGVPLHEAEARTLAFIMEHCAKGKALLCGNSIWQDKTFLVRYMPKVIEYLHYRLLDVSTVKELVHRWYPNDSHAQFQKQNKHRAVDDIRESVAELKNYRKYFFV